MVLRASGCIAMGPAGWRVLLQLVLSSDFPQFSKDGTLVCCETTQRLQELTGVCETAIRSTRRRLREAGLITLLNPEATHADHVSVYRLNAAPIQPLNPRAHPSISMPEIVAQRIARRRKRAAAGVRRRRQAARLKAEGQTDEPKPVASTCATFEGIGHQIPRPPPPW